MRLTKQSEPLEFFLNVSLNCIRDKDASVIYHITVPEFAEFTESSAPFRKNSIKLCLHRGSALTLLDQSRTDSIFDACVHTDTNAWCKCYNSNQCILHQCITALFPT